MSITAESPAELADQPYLRDSPVFRVLPLHQSYLDSFHFDSLPRAWEHTATVVSDLNQMVQEKGLAQQSVSMGAPRITLPVRTYDRPTGSFVPQLQILGTENLFEGDYPIVHGRFIGFDAIYPVTEVDQDGEPLQYRPKLTYRVLLPGLIEEANFRGPGFATAVTSETTLGFTHDRQRDESRTAMHFLLSSGTVAVRSLARRISQKLPPDNLTYKNLRDSARETRLTLNRAGEQFSQVERSAIVDLIQARSGLYAHRALHVASRAALVSWAGGSFVHDHVSINVTGGGLGFSQSFTLRNPTGPTEQMLHSPAILLPDVLVNGKSGTMHIPLERIETLKFLS